METMLSREGVKCVMRKHLLFILLSTVIKKKNKIFLFLKEIPWELPELECVPSKAAALGLYPASSDSQGRKNGNQ